MTEEQQRQRLENVSAWLLAAGTVALALTLLFRIPGNVPWAIILGLWLAGLGIGPRIEV